MIEVEEPIQNSAFPELIVGAWQLSQGHHKVPMTREDAFSAFDALLDLGVGTFDCADIYTGVEDLLGEWIRRVRVARGAEAADGVRVHTKLVPDRAALPDVDRNHVRRIVDRSRSRLGRDRLDLVQFAWWDYRVPGYVDTGTWLADMAAEGAIRRIGVTNFDAPRLREILDAGVPVEAQQLQYSALDHRPAGPMTRLCTRRGVAMLCYGTLAGGLLTDRWLGAPDPAPPGPQRSLSLGTRSLTKYRLIVDEFGGWKALQDMLETMRDVAERHRVTVAQVAIRYALSRRGVTSAIVGLSSPERMRECVAAASLTLDEADIERIHAHRVQAPGPGGSVFGLERKMDTDHARIMKYDLNRTAD